MSDYPGTDRAASHARRVADLVEKRSNSHGDAVTQHRLLATLWNMYLHGRPDVGLVASDVTMMLILLKVSRIMSSGLRREHVEDVLGYGALTLAALDSLDADATGSTPEGEPVMTQDQIDALFREMRGAS